MNAVYIYTYFQQLLLHTSLQPELLRNLQHKNRVLILHKTGPRFNAD